MYIFGILCDYIKVKQTMIHLFFWGMFTTFLTKNMRYTQQQQFPLKEKQNGRPVRGDHKTDSSSIYK